MTVAPNSTMVSWLLDMTKTQITLSRTLGENHGENPDTSLWLLKILAVFAELPLNQHTEKHKNNLKSIFIKKK